MGYACLQVWTFKNRVAFVLSVTDKGQPVRDGIKLQRLKQLLRTMMDKHGNGVVNIKTVHDFLVVPACVQPLSTVLCSFARGIYLDHCWLALVRVVWKCRNTVDVHVVDQEHNIHTFFHKSKFSCHSTLDLMLTGPLMDVGLVLQVQGEVHHDRRLHVLMLREEEMQWEQGHSKPRYHMRWNSTLGEAAASPTDSAGSMHAEYMNLPDADSDQLSHFRWLPSAFAAAPLHILTPSVAPRSAPYAVRVQSCHVQHLISACVLQLHLLLKLLWHVSCCLR